MALYNAWPSNSPCHQSLSKIRYRTLALRSTEIDETVWPALNSTKRCSFDPPKTGKIAEKVINYYGDEVLKIYPV